MKKLKRLSCFLLCLMVVPMLTVHAEELPTVENAFVIEADDNVTSKTDVNGSGIYAGNNVNFDNVMDGIGIFAGNNVNFRGHAEYGVLAGNNINIKGTINKEGFVFGNIINFESSFVGDRDLFVFGNTVTIDGTISRDVTVYAAQVVIKGKVEGNVTIAADKLEIQKEASIGGTLKYNEDAQTMIPSNATIGRVEKTAALTHTQTIQEVIWTFVINWGGMLFIFLAAALFVPALFKRIEEKTQNLSFIHVFSMLGYGLLLLMLIPILFVVLVSLVFGVPLAFLLLAFYVVFILLSTIFTGYLVGLIIWKNFIKKDMNILLVGLIGITTLVVLQSLPYIGTIIGFLSILTSLGMLVYLFKKGEV